MWLALRGAVRSAGKPSLDKQRSILAIAGLGNPHQREQLFNGRSRPVDLETGKFSDESQALTGRRAKDPCESERCRARPIASSVASATAPFICETVGERDKLVLPVVATVSVDPMASLAS
ncbi:hypothetical protein [Stutzerimonas xanthomarina]|uniref:hypothetical protein n=1 Tax=Stutzerimonas xanthomarina TaxID=271420 RepID=UPI003AA82D43